MNPTAETQFVPVIDISSHQGAWDPDKAVENGVGGVIIRLGNGSNVDKACATYVRQARSVGLDISWYWFMNPKRHPGVAGARTQASVMLEVAANLDLLDVAPMHDQEWFTNEYPDKGDIGISGQALQDWYAAAVHFCLDATGLTQWIYSSQSYYQNKSIRADEVRDCNFVVPRYIYYTQTAPRPPTDAREWANWAFDETLRRPQPPRTATGAVEWRGWQFSAGYNRMGAVYGFESTDLDLNIIDLAAWQEWVGTAQQQPDQPKPEPETPVVVTPPAPPLAVTPGKDHEMIVVEYGEAKDGLETAPWYHAIVIGPNGCTHGAGWFVEALKAAGLPRISLDRVTPGEGDKQVQYLIEKYGTSGSSPYGAGSPAVNATLDGVWMANQR